MLFTPLFGATAVLILLLLCFRFDARLMLTSLPPLPAPSLSNDPLAKIGWDDLDSDSEDTFFMSAAEIETFKADKTRREMEENRQKRMRALEEQEAAERDPNDPAGWGDSDEEVSHALSCMVVLVQIHLGAFYSLMKSNVLSWNVRPPLFHVLITHNN